MRLTTEQRLTALERENVVLHDTVKMLHKMIKEQRQLINEYITRNISAVREDNNSNGGIRPEDALYTFVCQQRFDRMEKQIKNIKNNHSQGVEKN